MGVKWRKIWQDLTMEEFILVRFCPSRKRGCVVELLVCADTILGIAAFVLGRFYVSDYHNGCPE